MINKAAIVSAFFEPADVLPRLRYAMVLHSPKDGYCGHKKKFGFAPSRVFQGHSEGIIAMCFHFSLSVPAFGVHHLQVRAGCQMNGRRKMCIPGPLHCS